MLGDDSVCQLDASGTAVCDALGRCLARPLSLSGDGAREFVSSWRRLADSDLLFVANMAESPTDVELTVGLDGPLVICDPDTLACFRPQVQDGRRFPWHFEPWQAFLIIVGQAATQKPDLPHAPAWLSPKSSRTLDGEWEFAAEPGNMLRLTTQVRPDPENQGVTHGWHCDTSVEGWLDTVDGRQLPEPLVPRDAPWYWMRATVECQAAAGPRFLVCDNPDFLEVYVNGRAAEQVAHGPLWTGENVWFDVRGLFAEGRNTTHIRARTSKYSDPRIGAFPISARLLQPVVLVGEFLVEDGSRLVPWAGELSADRSWEQQGLPHVAGVGVYRRSLDWDGSARPLLHLPQCVDAVEVRVNSHSCGVRVWPPYVFELTPGLRDGRNDLEIRVSNTLGNIITETYAGHQPDLPTVSGLLAPPRLLGC